LSSIDNTRSWGHSKEYDFTIEMAILRIVFKAGLDASDFNFFLACFPYFEKIKGGL
jgi:hypothetical protein